MQLDLNLIIKVYTMHLIFSPLLLRKRTSEMGAVSIQWKFWNCM